MKYCVTVLLIVLSFVLPSQGQPTAANVRLGYYGPHVSAGGFILGSRWERVIDENLHVGFEGDWFNKSFVDKELAKGFDDFVGVQGTVNELRAKTNLHSFPLLGTMEINFPISPTLRAFANAGVGFDFLLLYYRDYGDPEKDRARGAIDFSWRIGAGVLLPLGRRSDFLAEIGYHSSNPGWEYTVYDPVLKKSRVFERSYDMSGFMFRAGIRFFY